MAFCPSSFKAIRSFDADQLTSLWRKTSQDLSSLQPVTQKESRSANDVNKMSTKVINLFRVKAISCGISSSSSISFIMHLKENEGKIKRKPNPYPSHTHCSSSSVFPRHLNGFSSHLLVCDRAWNCPISIRVFLNPFRRGRANPFSSDLWTNNFKQSWTKWISPKKFTLRERIINKYWKRKDPWSSALWLNFPTNK